MDTIHTFLLIAWLLVVCKANIKTWRLFVFAIVAPPHILSHIESLNGIKSSGNISSTQFEEIAKLLRKFFPTFSKVVTLLCSIYMICMNFSNIRSGPLKLGVWFAILFINSPNFTHRKALLYTIYMKIKACITNYLSKKWAAVAFLQGPSPNCWLEILARLVGQGRRWAAELRTSIRERIWV